MLTKNQTIPQFVLDAALTLHEQSNENLSYGPIGTFESTIAKDDLLWNFFEDRVEFVNLEARNHCTALAIFQQLTTSSAPDELFDAAHKLWRNEIGHSDSAAGRLLGIASHKSNVLMNAAQVIRSKNSHSSKVFEVLHLIEVALPHLSEISAEGIIELVEAQHEATKHDMAVGRLSNTIERRLRSEPKIAWDIWNISRENISESMQSLYVTALAALMHTDQQSTALEKAWEESEHVNPLIAAAALKVLGNAIWTHTLHESDVDKSSAVLISKSSGSSVETQQAAISAIAYASLKNDRLLTELVRLSNESDDYTLEVIANFLFMEREEFSVSQPHFNTLLKSLVRLSPSQKFAIDKFDWVLHQLYAKPENRTLVVNCLMQWIVLHGGEHLSDRGAIELFDQTFMQIANDQPGLQTVITHWLAAPEKQLAVACGGLISYLDIRGMKTPTFSPDVLNQFELQDFKFLARRLLGFVIYEEPLLSLTFSLLETEDAPTRSFAWVNSLLINHIGRDYSHATMEALKTRLETARSPEKELFEKIYATLLQRITAINNLPRLQELRPPTRLQRAIALNRAREMEIAKEQADEKSIFRQITKVIPMKAGKGWFSVSKNQVGPTQHLQSISHSMTLPKRSITDPIGYAIDGILYRNSQRDDQ